LSGGTGLLWYLLLGGPSGLVQLTTYLILGLFAASVDFLWGYGGMLSFGQAAFFGLGSFGYAIITTGRVAAIPPAAGLLGLVIGTVVPALLAFLLGYFLFYGHVTGPYFTIVTLALSFLMSSLALAWPSLFGGYTGIANVPPLRLEFPGVALSFGGAVSGFMLVALSSSVIICLLRWILESPFGLLVDGLRDNEDRLQYLGISTARVKLTIFVLSSSVAGFAGCLFAAQSGYVAPELLGVMLSTEVVVFVAVGGRRTLFGGLVGSIIVRGVGYWLGGVALEYWQLLMGAMFIIVVLFAKSGIVGLGSYLHGVHGRRVFKKMFWEKGPQHGVGDK